MLDKFRFFKDKDKDKDKEKSKGVARSSSKGSSTSSTSRSDTDSRTSSNGATKSPSFGSSHSSSSGDTAGPSSEGAFRVSAARPDGATDSHFNISAVRPDGTTDGNFGLPISLLQSKLTSKSGKKSQSKSSSHKNDIPEEHLLPGTHPSTPSSAILGTDTSIFIPGTPTGCQLIKSSSQGRKSTSKCDKNDSRQVPSSESDVLQSMPRLNQDSSTLSKKSSSRNSGTSSIPKTHSSSLLSTKSSKGASSSSSNMATSPSSSSIPNANSGIPKPSSGKSGKYSSRQDRIRTSSASEGQKVAYKDDPRAQELKYFVAGAKPPSPSSSSHCHLHQQQLQQSAQQLQQSAQQHLYQNQQAYLIRQQEQQNQQHFQHSSYSSHHHHHQHQHPHHVTSPLGIQPTPDNPYTRPYGYTPHYAHNPGYATPTKLLTNQQSQNIHPRPDFSNMKLLSQTQQESGDQVIGGATVQQRSSSQSLQYIPVTISAPRADTHFVHLSLAGRSTSKNLPHNQLTNASLSRHSPSVNVVKPTVSSPTSTTSTHKTSKSDSNTQTNLSVLRKSTSSKHSSNSDNGVSSQNDAVRNKVSSFISRKTENSANVVRNHRLNDSANKEISMAGTSNSFETQSEAGRLFNDAIEQNGIEPIASVSSNIIMTQNPAASDIKSTASSTPKTASNIAIVQPRPGQKIETTFDAEVRTETVHKGSVVGPEVSGQTQGRETTFLTPDQEEKTTFVDDTGEAMDIKPMPPIMRALPYGYFRGSSGYGGFNAQNFHIPGISMPTTAVYVNKTPSGQLLDMPRPIGVQSSRKFPSEHMKRTGSGSCPESASSDPDYTSESDTYECVSGYMSDGDILKGDRSNGAESGDEWTCGYMSEGGASLYARRLQQRFREGMQAVRDCMQKSTGIVDDDSFEDSSSISSGDASDNIPENSTDDKLTGSSLDALSDNLYQSPKGLFSSSPKSPGYLGSIPPPLPSARGIKIPNLGTRSSLDNPYSKDPTFSPGSPWGRKFSLPQSGAYLSNDPNKLLSSDPSDYGYGYSWPSSRSDGGFSSLRKLSAASNPDYAYHSECDYDSPHGSYSQGLGIKRDTDITNDQTQLIEASIRCLQVGRMGNGQHPTSDGQPMQFGYTRPLSISSSGENNNRSKIQGYSSSATGSRLAKYGSDQQRSHGSSAIPRPASATDKPLNPDLGSMEAYASSSLDRKKTSTGLTSSRSAGNTQTDRDFHSNSLGRLSLFASKDRHAQVVDSSGSNVHSAPGTVIPNPHVGSGFVGDMQMSHYVNLQELHARISGSGYAPLDFPSSPRHSVTGITALGPGINGSSLSLVSSSSSLFSSAEERHAHEVRKLKRDLVLAQEKVQTLSSQLNTNAHVVSAFEQSLSSMTSRLQSLSNGSDHKDTELNELRMTIEALKLQSKMALLDPLLSPAASRRHTTPGMKNINIASALDDIARQMSSDSMSSINSLSSACSRSSQQSAHTDSEATKQLNKQAKKKGWLRSSFSKAFSRKKAKSSSLSDAEPDFYSLRSNVSAPNSPLLHLGHLGPPSMKGSQSSGALCDSDVNALRQALRDKDMKLTDIQLEALSSAHQLEQLREAMTKMKNEMTVLRADNDRLHMLMSTSQSSRVLNLTHLPLSPHHSRTSSESLDRSFSLMDHTSLDLLLAETAANERDGKRVIISVVLGSNPDLTRTGLEKPAEVYIGTMTLSGTMKWDVLDNVVRKVFKEYVLRVDPVANLGLSAESIYSYVVGEINRTKESEVPELLPVGYLVGDTTQVEICLKGTKQSCVDSLSFETMIPKTVVQRYVSLLLEHRRIILCGPGGVGKTYLAQKLAEHVALRSGRDLTAGSVATFNVDHRSAEDLRQYLINIAEQCESMNEAALPTAIILDNLHHVSSFTDVFHAFLSVKYQNCPYIIGTMSQSSCSATNLQLHHNFRFVLCANHAEVKSFLGRYLRRKLVESEIRTGIRSNDLNRVVDWVPKVWAHLNKVLEAHSLADVTVGPRLFMSCPMDVAGSQVWFTDLWNYTLVETVREGLQMYGCHGPWEDPTDWVLESYPWPNRGSGVSLMHIRVDDLGYEQHTVTAAPSVLTNPAKMPVGDSKDAESMGNILMTGQEDVEVFNNSSIDHHSSSDIGTSVEGRKVAQDYNNGSAVESRL